MRVFLAAAYYSYRGNSMAWYFYAISLFVTPLVQPAFFALLGTYGGGRPLEFYLIGNAVAITALGAHVIALAMNWDRNQGMLVHLVASPAPQPAVFFGAASLRILEAMARAALALLWARIIFGLDMPVLSWLGLFGCIVVAAVAVSGLSLLVGATSYLALDASVIGNVVIFAVLFLSGANVPLDELPPALQLVSWTLPLTRSIAAARQVATGGDLADALPLLAGDLLLGAVFAGAGLLVLRWFETQARRRGTLEAV